MTKRDVKVGRFLPPLSIAFFIKPPHKDENYIEITLSVRPSVSPSASLSVRLSVLNSCPIHIFLRKNIVGSCFTHILLII